LIRPLSHEVWHFRKQVLTSLRDFFDERGFLEVSTPGLNPTGAVEPFIDSFQVERHAPAKSQRQSPGQGYLITSPEYNLKILAAELKTNVYEICHVFREGDRGPEHTEEFLMLEWYALGSNMEDLLAQTTELIQLVGARLDRSEIPVRFERHTIEELFRKYAGCGTDHGDLLDVAEKLGLGKREDRYDELFFSIFLNRVEPNLQSTLPFFITDYPAPLAALSRVNGKIARRFELYWGGLEIANGYEELLDYDEHVRRFQEFNEIRIGTGRKAIEADSQFMAVLREKSLQPCAGIALGIERLMMALLRTNQIDSISPFP